ncbi:BrnT family toxin [Amycolatopsis echigonensis]|uniref:BrnT family toxin n=1 Tax=Amycolatopsis echigonensis TaxID=2576905 RepID=A0A8E1VZU7_9PSEU|nr:MULTISPECIES: hypothetical protein [Amycolatopsis]MBB2501177.1 hypothetical protein [Amycolatopsis echigonensis]
MREIHWTEQSEEHIAWHQVRPEEVEEVIYTHPRLTLSGRDDTTLVFGSTANGRRLLVVLAEAADGREYVVTARNMTTAERRTFDKKAR